MSSGDYISREVNGDDFVRRADIVEKFMDRLPSISVGYLCKIADEIPPANIQPVPEGQWVELPRDTPNPITGKCGVYVGCSNCHAPIPTDSYLDFLNESDSKFCYSCGANMRGT